MLDFESEPLKSLVAQDDFAGVASVLLWTAAPRDEAALQELWVFVALNTFDLGYILSFHALWRPCA
jgi:hypothetical protein